MRKQIFSLLPLEKPLAWAQLSHQKVRLAVAITGVSFANILMFTMMGLQSLIADGATTFHESLEGDLFLTSAFSPSLRIPIALPRAYLIQADAVNGVASAAPLYLNSASWTHPNQLDPSPATQPSGDIFGNQVRVVAFNPSQPVLNIPEVNQHRERLSSANSVLFDRLSQPSLGDIPALLESEDTVHTLMAGRRVYIMGLFSLGSTVIEKGTVVMSDLNYSQWFGDTALNEVTLGVLTVEPSHDIEAVKAQLQEHLPSDKVTVLTLDELIEKEHQFTQNDPIGIIFGFGSMVGFVVGIVIVYQVLYTDISDHLPEYATLKAMGYSDGSLLRVVLLEALLLAVLGFVPGFFTSLGLYQILTTLTRIPLIMQSTVALQVFLLTLVMCNMSGAIAMRRLQSADPADVF